MFFVLLFGRGPRPRPNSKKKTRPRPNSKKKTRPRPFRAYCFFLLFGRVGVFISFSCLGEGRVFFLLFGRVACLFFFLLFGRGRVLFCCLGGGVFFFLLFGPGACFFLLFGRETGVHSLTRLPGSSLSTQQQKRPNSTKQNTGSREEGWSCCYLHKTWAVIFGWVELSAPAV